MKYLIALLLPTLVLAFDTFESERYLYAYHRFTKEIKRLSSNIPLSQSDSKMIQDLKFEIKSCGISSTVNSCLESKFKSNKSLETFLDDNKEGYRFLIKAFSQGMSDYSLIIQVMTIHAESEKVLVDKVEYFKESIPVTREGFADFFEKYLRKDYKKIFETTEFYPNDFSNYLEIAKNSKNPLEIFHSVSLAKTLDSENLHQEEVDNLLKEKFGIIFQTTSPIYQVEFLKLFANFDDFNKKLAENFFQSTDPQVRGKSAIILSNLGINDVIIKQTIITIIKTGLDVNDQMDALDGLFKIKNGIEDDLLILQTVKNAHPDFSRKAFELAVKINFTTDHLSYLAGEIKNPNPEYRVYMLDFLSKIDSSEAIKIIVNCLDDITEAVTRKAFTILKDRNLDGSDFTKIKKIIRTIKDFTKFYCLQLLDKDKSEEISELLMDHLNDLSPRVEELAVILLEKREITPGIKKTLWRMVKRKKTKVYALRILSKLETDDVTSLLIEELNDLDNINNLYDLIKKRNLNAGFYDKIKSLTQNQEPKIRIVGVKLLAKYPDNITLDFLKLLLTQEIEKSVKNTIETLIKYLEEKLTPQPAPAVSPS